MCARTGYSNSGQSCISVQRVYVQRERFGAFLDAFTAEVAGLRTGDPLDEATDVGSMVDEEAAERVVRWAAQAAADGAEVVLGGTRDGATVAPTVVAHPPPTAAVVTREVFGALVAVLPYDAFGEVIATCNASRYGLQAGLFTRDIGRILAAWRDLQVGGLVVNGSSNFRLDHVPFGGVKDSGFGREAPRWMIDDFTVTKTLLLRGLSLFGAERMITAAAALAAQLESYGVRYVFGTCGHTNIALLDALSRSRIRFVIARHEQAAAHAADGYARMSGRPGVLLLHVGPGMMNAVTGVATAALDSIPLVAISGDVPSYYAGPAPAPGSQPARRRRPDRDLPAVRQAGLARAPGRGPAPVHRARVLDRDLGPAGRGAPQRADGHLLPARIGEPGLPAARGHRPARPAGRRTRTASPGC